MQFLSPNFASSECKICIFEHSVSISCAQNLHFLSAEFPFSERVINSGGFINNPEPTVGVGGILAEQQNVWLPIDGSRVKILEHFRLLPDYLCATWPSLGGFVQKKKLCICAEKEPKAYLFILFSTFNVGIPLGKASVFS